MWYIIKRLLKLLVCAGLVTASILNLLVRDFDGAFQCLTLALMLLLFDDLAEIKKRLGL